MTNKKSNHSIAGEVLENLIAISGIILLCTAKTIWRGIKANDYRSTLFRAYLAVNLTIAWCLAFPGLHFEFLHSNLPFFDTSFYVMESWGILINLVVLWIIFVLAYFFFQGIFPEVQCRYYQKSFDKIPIKNAQNETPKVVGFKKNGRHQQTAKVWIGGMGIDQLEKNKSRISSAMKQDVDEIRPCRNRSYAEVTFTNKELPKFVKFSEVENEIKSDGHFLLGESKRETVGAKISELPHMMIAGATGTGKSQCFKQALLGLLMSTPKLQMYLIDLKGGIEFREFATLPNVLMAKTIEDAVSLLTQVKAEMYKRFTFLEEKGYSNVDFTHDPFDRIVVGIDEASVLYANARRDSSDYELIKQARELTEEIAKLSRASGISLILATQKVTKETIDTRIQENISGRMCFKQNTIEGSVRVLGNGAATNLDSIPGRGIWQFGSRQVEVQVPFLSTPYLKTKLSEISKEFESNKRELRQKMLSIGLESISKSEALRNIIKKEVRAYEYNLET